MSVPASFCVLSGDVGKAGVGDGGEGVVEVFGDCGVGDDGGGVGGEGGGSSGDDVSGERVGDGVCDDGEDDVNHGADVVEDVGDGDITGCGVGGGLCVLGGVSGVGDDGVDSVDKRVGGEAGEVLHVLIEVHHLRWFLSIGFVSCALGLINILRARAAGGGGNRSSPYDVHNPVASVLMM